MLMSAEVRGCVTWFICFLDFLCVRYNCAKFHHCRICVTDFREGGLFALPISESPRKYPSWIGLKYFIILTRSMLWTSICYFEEIKFAKFETFGKRGQSNYSFSKFSYPVPFNPKMAGGNLKKALAFCVEPLFFLWFLILS